MPERLADLKTPDGELPDERYDPPPPPRQRAGWKPRLPSRRVRRPEASAKAPIVTGDRVIGGLGVTLGLACALFPWYIFMNPEKFQVRGYPFSGTPSAGHPSGNSTYQPARLGAPMDLPDSQTAAALDMFPTGTVPVHAAKPPAVGKPDQPFPGDTAMKPDFNLIQVANGRAMIEDADGIWVVQAGSPLPNDSRVASIERRDGKWVLVTSAKDVIPLAK